jgi:hypothetical protein
MRTGITIQPFDISFCLYIQREYVKRKADKTIVAGEITSTLNLSGSNIIHQTIDTGMGRNTSRVERVFIKKIEIADIMNPLRNRPAKTLSPISHPQFIQAIIPAINPRIEKMKRVNSERHIFIGLKCLTSCV